MARVSTACPFTWQKCCSRSSPFTLMDTFLTFLSIGSFLADIGTDLIVIIQYYKDDHIMWMLLTTSLVCIPSLIVQIFSVRWYIIDGRASNSLWIIHIFQLGLFHRYIKLLQLGLKVRKTKNSIDLQNFNQQQSDICMLRLFESFTESAPQLVLQLYIMVSTEEWNPWTGISAVASVLSLGWGISAYSKSMRSVRPEKKTLSWWGLLFQALWRIGMVSSRVTAMVLFAAIFGQWLLLVFALHWLSMTVWVFMQKTDFCTTWWEERLYNCVVGAIYCFCFFNLKEGKSRFRMSLYYSLTIVQNTSFVLTFYFSDKKSHSLKDVMASFVPCGMIIGLCSMMIYYRFFHPSGPITLFRSKFSSEYHDEPSNNNKNITLNYSNLKTSRRMHVTTDIYPADDCDFPIHQVTQLNGDVNTNVSVISAEQNVSCVSDLHRSHSLNCSLGSYGFVEPKIDIVSRQRIKRNAFANRHRQINYHFRPAVAFGCLSSNIHCSCLILTKDIDTKIPDNPVGTDAKHSASLPNLEVSFESEDISYPFSISASSSLKSSGFKNTSYSSHTESSSPPLIYNDHIIRLNIEMPEMFVKC
ncbi:XK-related protein 4-like [Stegodyphus dumicola]|uniref:XK-related protein 4-like n=1 Tax=Stegodyphus dumicola TaxID=202533 RepID=UPI0015B331BA|nr:XK-related protein 4-like [Stegodyphus dumicola]